MANLDVKGSIDFESLGGGCKRVILDLIYPVGIIIEFDADTDPNTIMQGQVWQEWGQGRVVVGAGSYTDKNSTAKTFTRGMTDNGEYNHTLSVEEMPTHQHTVAVCFGGSGDNWASANYRGGGSTDFYKAGMADAFGGSQSHNNIQPYIVAKRWKRTA